MADRLTITAGLTVGATSSGCCSDGDSLSREASEVIGLDGTAQSGSILLGTDTPESIAFGDLASANVVWLAVTGGKVRARLTSADGTQQAVPVDDLLIIVSRSVPFTAIDLTRVTGQTPRVTYVLGQKI